LPPNVRIGIDSHEHIILIGTDHPDRFMAETPPPKLTASTALRMVRELAADSGRIVIVEHWRARMVQRRMTRRQVALSLHKGTSSEGPYLNRLGNWQVNIHRHAAGEELTCSVAIEWAKRLLVITAF